MEIRHEINEQEMINIFDQFAALIIDGYPCEELTEYLHESVRELAVDQSAVIAKGDFTYILEDFISCFTFDDENGGYNWEDKNSSLGMCFQGETKVIRTGVNDARSKAYRDMWKAIYHIARGEAFYDKQGHDDKVIYVVKYILKAANTKVDGHAIGLDNVIKMVELAIDLTQPELSEKPPAQSELRRLELKEKARIVEQKRIYNGFCDNLHHSHSAISVRDKWTFFYRAQRFGQWMLHYSGWLLDFDLADDKTRHQYTSKMKECASHIFFPELTSTLSRSNKRRNELAFFASEHYIAQKKLVQAQFDEDTPF